MNSTAIKGQFTRYVKTKMGSENPHFNRWYVGITNNEQRRKIEHQSNYGSLKYWKCIKANNVNEANQVEEYFSLIKGTSNLPFRNGAAKNSSWVYIFKKPTESQYIGINGITYEEDFLKCFF